MALTSDNGSEEWTETAGGVIEECDRLIGMINDMLEIAEANSGTFVKATARVDIMTIVSEAFELFQPVAEDEGIKLKIDSSPVSMITTGDLPRLQRTVANLLDNAIKYTPAGGTIRLSVRRNRDEFIVDVIDSGEGIREEDLPHIFNRFYRGDRSRSTPGHGLGLSLAQAIIRAHGGNLAVKSHPGQGSTFTVHIPRT
jgi:signal transduction histidine kinase